MDTGKPIEAIGTVSTQNGGTAIYTVPIGIVAKVTGIQFCNSTGSTCVLSVYLQYKGATNKTLLYNLNLDSGDIVNDDTEKILSEGTAIIAKCSILLVNYVISGYENKK